MGVAVIVAARLRGQGDGRRVKRGAPLAKGERDAIAQFVLVGSAVISYSTTYTLNPEP
jgi:hypothetical protein